jgi:hypothetical protein
MYSNLCIVSSARAPRQNRGAQQKKGLFFCCAKSVDPFKFIGLHAFSDGHRVHQDTCKTVLYRAFLATTWLQGLRIFRRVLAVHGRYTLTSPSAKTRSHRCPGLGAGRWTRYTTDEAHAGAPRRHWEILLL